MNALSHPLLHLSLKIAVGVACTVATGIAVSYGLGYIIRDHNSLAFRRELRARKRKLLDVLKGIEGDCTGPAEAQIAAARSALQRAGCGGPAVRSVAAAAESPGGASFPARTAASSPPRASAGRAKPPSGPRAAALPPSPLAIKTKGVSAGPDPSAFHTPRSPSHPPLPPALDLASATVPRHLREADETLVRVLERLDAVRPAEIRQQLTEGAAVDVETDADARRIGEQAVELVRARKKAIVRRAQRMLNEIDRLCGLAGIPSVGHQHGLVK